MWKLLLVHAFNPLLIGYVLLNFSDLNQRRSAVDGSTPQESSQETLKEAERAPTLKDAPQVYLMSCFMYLLMWLLPHYVLVQFLGSGFDLTMFLGANEPLVYYIPYAFGAYYLLNTTVLKPLLARHAASLLGINTALNGIAFFASAYCLLVFYVKWL